VLALGTLLVACGGSSTTTTTTKAPATTTTTLTAEQTAVLTPLLLAASDLPAGWTLDRAPNATSTQNAPGCVADVVTVQGSAAHVSAAFLGPGSQPTVAIQTVATFAPGTAAASADTLRTRFQSYNGGTLKQDGSSAHVTVKPLAVASTGDAGFAAQMTLTANKKSIYFDAFYAVKGDHATFLGWTGTTSATTAFERAAAAALAKL